MLDDLTPEEVIALVRCMGLADNYPGIALIEGPGRVMTTLEALPGVEGLAKKLNQAGEREDVRKYIQANSGNDEPST
jgi:hypothetical protein